MKRNTLALLAIGGLFLFSLFGRVTAEAKEWSFEWDSDGEAAAVDEEQFAGGYLGVTLAELDRETAAEAGLRDRDGALILTVLNDTPADEAGLEAGDVVVGVDRERVDDPADLTRLVRSADPGDKVKLRIYRDGRKKTVTVELAERERRIDLFMDGDVNGRWFRHGRHLSRAPGGRAWTVFGDRGRLGVEVRALDDDLAEYFRGADEGVLVLGVNDDTPAEKVGLKPGDVIVRLGDREIATVADLHDAVSEAADEGDVDIHYIRKGKKRKAEVEIEGCASPLSRIVIDDDGRPARGRRLRSGSDEDLRQLIEKLEMKIERLEKRLEDG